MATIEDKISMFSKIICDVVNEEKRERLATFNLQAEKRINEERENIEKLRCKLKSEVLKKSYIKANEIVAKERLNKQRQILILKDKLIGYALEGVHEKLVNFVNSEDYKPYFISALKKTLEKVDKGSYYIIVLNRDYERFQIEMEAIIHNQNGANIKVSISKEDFIGGFMLTDFEETFKIDNSILCSLQDSKEKIGIKVMEVLA